MENPLVKYSLVIPCYNESDNLPILIDRCRALLKSRRDIEVVLVNNGSTDNTREVLMDLSSNSSQINLQVVHIHKNQGYGFGIISGLKECSGDMIGWTHADLQTDPLDFINAISIFERSNQPTMIFIKGNRINRPFKDIIFTQGMSIIERVLLGTHMLDINAQPTVFPKIFFTSLEGMPNDFSLDLFIYYKAIHCKMNIKRFPVNFEPRLKGEGHNETLLSKLKYSYKTILYSMELRRKLKKPLK